jgi:hypothetical protein
MPLGERRRAALREAGRLRIAAEMNRRRCALFCVQMPIIGAASVPRRRKVFDFIDGYGGRTRDRTLDLSRVKGTLSR